MNPNKSNALILGFRGLNDEAFDILYQSFNIIGIITDGDESISTKNDFKQFEFKDITQQVLEFHKITQVIIELQSIDPYKLLEQVIYFYNLGLEIKSLTIKSTHESNSHNTFTVNNLKFTDLINEEVAPSYSETLLNHMKDQTLLITGAAGSIGSELARMLLNFNFKTLVLLDNAESALYELQQELITRSVLNVIYTIGDVRSYNSMDSIFKLYKPTLVFHAAAYKHVPLMEAHPAEAIQTNILGTKHIANLAKKHHVEQFVLISSDKAVNPTNVMGATKRAGELYIEYLNSISDTQFKTARFGNVLASNGSVIPLFHKQIEKGGPITVTDKAIERYFISLKKACELILECTVLKDEASIYVFEMGKPVRIYDLAKLMIGLNKAHNQSDIKIRITGSRPGEKIQEELVSSEENSSPTEHKFIKAIQASAQNISDFETKISKLCSKTHEFSNLELVEGIKAIVTNFTPNNPIYSEIEPKSKQS
ncbi:polysaccharide biosynthesis protein [Geojedonia litorea]|uniref:Polysaccharide biosynthesis protein n=1 Tax=Geojedonia litorea TaxID=1268269 RepID=A0ABV9N0X7_9FLAO